MDMVYILLRWYKKEGTDCSSVVVSVFAIVILSVIGALFEVRHLNTPSFLLSLL